MQPGGPLPETVISILCMQNASLSRADYSLILASAQGCLEIAAAASQMRRLFGPTGATVRQDVFMANGNEEDF